jgi:hypothetical protein
MSAVTKNEPGFEAWLASAERKILLPTGTWMKIVVPSVRKLRRRNVFPNELLPMVKKFENEGVTLSELEDDELDSFVRMMRFLMADMIRAILVPDETNTDELPSGKWETVKLTGADLEEADIDEEDATALQAIAIRRLTPNQVTIASRRDRELAKMKTLSPEEQRAIIRRRERELEIERKAESEIESEAEGTVPGWQNFREHDGGARDGESVRAVRDSAESTAGDR